MNLKIGSYKNYKAMCEENGLEIKTGKSKQLQIKENIKKINKSN